MASAATATTVNEPKEKENLQVDESAVTIPAELSQRHPLQSSWALWYLKGDRTKEWEDCLKRVSIFDTVEDFWALYNHIQPASGLSWNSDYYLFKEGIKPMWEDASNIKGGRWLVVVDKHKRAVKLDQYWLELMMAIIGEQFEEYGDLICGAVVNVRQKGDKVALWTRDAQQEQSNLRIGMILKSKLDIPDSEVIRYEVHKDSSQRTGSGVKAKIVLPAKEENSSKSSGELSTEPPESGIGSNTGGSASKSPVSSVEPPAAPEPEPEADAGPKASSASASSTNEQGDASANVSTNAPDSEI